MEKGDLIRSSLQSVIHKQPVSISKSILNLIWFF